MKQLFAGIASKRFILLKSVLLLSLVPTVTLNCYGQFSPRLVKLSDSTIATLLSNSDANLVTILYFDWLRLKADSLEQATEIDKGREFLNRCLEIGEIKDSAYSKCDAAYTHCEKDRAVEKRKSGFKTVGLYCLGGLDLILFTLYVIKP